MLSCLRRVLELACGGYKRDVDALPAAPVAGGQVMFVLLGRETLDDGRFGSVRPTGQPAASQPAAKAEESTRPRLNIAELALVAASDKLVLHIPATVSRQTAWV